MVKLSTNACWYEEYASKDRKPPFVLNGMIFAILGVYDYYLTTKDVEAKEIFDKGVNALLLLIDKFNYDGWSYYDLEGQKATFNYHLIHVQLLKRLYEITNEEKFNYYYELWKQKL